jgi:hypothetical protein
MKLRYYKRSTVISVSCNESQVSEAKRAETCWTNYPTREAKWDYNEAEGNESQVSEAKRVETCLTNYTPQLALGFISVIYPAT